MSPLIGLAFSEAALDYLATVPTKYRGQIVRKAKALMLDQHPKTSKPLKGSATTDGLPIHRERSGDYRILYVVRDNPTTVVILDIDHRKDVYR